LNKRTNCLARRLEPPECQCFVGLPMTVAGTSINARSANYRTSKHAELAAACNNSIARRWITHAGLEPPFAFSPALGHAILEAHKRTRALEKDSAGRTQWGECGTQGQEPCDKSHESCHEQAYVGPLIGCVLSLPTIQVNLLRYFDLPRAAATTECCEISFHINFSF